MILTESYHFLLLYINSFQRCVDMSEDRRKQERVSLIYYLAVFDRNTDDLMGYLADISLEGAMLLCEKSLEIDSDYQFKIEVFSASSINKQIEFDAKCVWRKKNEYIDFFNFCLKFIKIESKNIDEIQSLIDTYRLNE